MINNLSINDHNIMMNTSYVIMLCPINEASYLSGSLQELHPHWEKSQHLVKTSVSQNLRRWSWYYIYDIYDYIGIHTQDWKMNICDWRYDNNDDNHMTMMIICDNNLGMFISTAAKMLGRMYQVERPGLSWTCKSIWS